MFLYMYFQGTCSKVLCNTLLTSCMKFPYKSAPDALSRLKTVLSKMFTYNGSNAVISSELHVLEVVGFVFYDIRYIMS